MHTFSRAPARPISTGTIPLAPSALTIALGAVASGKVSISSTDARQDGLGKATEQVPDESETAVTTKVSFSMPAVSSRASADLP